MSSQRVPSHVWYEPAGAGRSPAYRPRPAHIRRSAPARRVFSAAVGGLVRDWTAESEGCLSRRRRQHSTTRARSWPPASGRHRNLALLSNTPQPAPFGRGDFNSDLAFENGYAFGGNYDGVQIWDVRDPDHPALAASIHCPGSQNDVTVNDGILVTSTDSVRNKAECEGNMSVPTDSPEYGQPTNWEGLRVFDVRNPYRPKY